MIEDEDIRRDRQADAEPAGPQCRADLDDLEDAVMVALRAVGLSHREAVWRAPRFLRELEGAGYGVWRS